MLRKQHPSIRFHKLTRRERQILQIVVSRGGATAAEVRSALEDPPTYSAVRALLAVMEKKRLLSHREDGPRYVYTTVLEQRRARQSVLKEMVSGFFNGSRMAVVEALLDPADGRLTKKELEELSRLIEQAKKQGR